MSSAPSPWVLGARSETGYVRSVNEDRMGWTRTPYGDVFAVSDGMGGHLGGALAAEITVRTLQQQLALIPPASNRFGDHVRQAFLVANRDVFTKREANDPLTREMGATGVALVTSGARFIVAHVGDSRAYLWRGHQLRQLTRDHTRVQGMVDSGLLSAQQALTHPDASVLDRAIGHQATVDVDVTDWIDLEPSDMLLLCSDGLCGYMTDAEIAAILSAGGDPQACTNRLIEAALGKGGHDNVTVQLVRFAPSTMRTLNRALARPAFVAPACIGLTAIAAYVMAANQMDSYRKQVAELRADLQNVAAAPMASAASAAPPASAASTPAPALPNPAASAPVIALPASAATSSARPAPRPLPSGASSAVVGPAAAARSQALPHTSAATTKAKPAARPGHVNPPPPHQQPSKATLSGGTASGPAATPSDVVPAGGASTPSAEPAPSASAAAPP